MIKKSMIRDNTDLFNVVCEVSFRFAVMILGLGSLLFFGWHVLGLHPAKPHHLRSTSPRNG